VLPAGNDPRRHGKEEVQLPVDVNQTDQLVAAVLLVTLVPQIHLLGIDRVVVLVEPQQVQVLLVFVVGDEQVGAVANEQALLVEEPQRTQAARHFPVEPGVQPVDLGAAGKLAQEVLVAGSLTVVVVLAVEAGTGKRDVVGFRVDSSGSRAA